MKLIGFIKTNWSMIKMAKKSENSINDDWLDDLDMGNIEKSANLDIKPSLKINLNDSVNVVIIEKPVLTEFADGNSYYTMIVEKNDIHYQFNCNAKSFRFQLAVLQKKHGNLINKRINITKVIGNTKEFKNAELYQLTLIE